MEMSDTARTAFNPVGVFARVFLPFGIGYFLSCAYRTVNVVLGPEIATSVGLGAAELGLLTSMYFVAIAGFQIPLGVLLDRHGARRVEAVLLLIATAGALIFAFGQSALTLAIGRALIGLGVSSCLMAALKANAHWYPAERIPLANGAIFALGGLGAIVAAAPVEAALAMISWRSIFVVLGLITALTALAIYAITPDGSSRGTTENWPAAFQGALRVFADPRFLRIAPLATLIQGSFLAYQGLWAAAWLRDVEGFGPARIGAALSMAGAGIILGTFGTGLAADWFKRRGISILSVSLAVSAGYIFIQLALVLRLPVSAPLIWGGFAFFGMGSSIWFAVLAHVFPQQIIGRANTALNMLILSGAFLLQWTIGILLDFWLLPDDGIYPAAHLAIMGGLICVEVVAILWLWIGRRSIVGAHKPLLKRT